MNPNAKEFVPAHILRKRQDEAMGSLARQMGDVDLDESKKVGGGSGETSCNAQQNSTRTSSTSNDKTQNQTSTANTNNRGPTADPSKETDPPSEEQSQKAQHNSFDQTNERSNNHHETNGELEQDFDEDDRYLLKAGENYCEFNGEQFIIPGDDDEYDDDDNPGSDTSHPGYDFGNAEDNEDEDVINAYDAFLSELP